MYDYAAKSCPGDGGTCSGNGNCDQKTGLCVCNQGYQGIACSGKIQN